MKQTKMRPLGVYKYLLHVVSVFLVLTIYIPPATSSGNEGEHAALLAFKSKITHDPQGVFSSWNNSLHFCNWEGVTCSQLPRRVATLDLSSKGLVGSLSPAIGNLSFLQQIILFNNNLQGIIPEELGHLFKLKLLILTHNNLVGEIPKNISKCSNLIKLSLAENKLTGKLPIELTSLSMLEELDLDSNNFTGEIPPFIGNLTSLQVLSATQNAFTGQVSLDFGLLLNLQKLRLGNNYLGNGEQDDLIFLGSLAKCSSLEVLELDDNNFGGSLHTSISNISTSLTTIDFAGNQISGRIPSEISKFTNLIYLSLGSNKFTGNIPTEIVKLRKLQRIVLSDNRLVGTIPASIGNLSMLDQLHFDNNELEGTIPPSFGNCHMLVLLDLSQNNLTGSIPNKLFDALAFSIMLNLSQNHLVGSLPSNIGRLKTLGKLDVSENQLSGEIPREIGDCTGLEKLYIQGNFIQGQIPHSMINLKSLQNFDLSRNNVSGQIPDFLETMSLKYLNLSWNDFEGEVSIRGVFANVSAFSVVGNTKLCGGIPKLQLKKCSIAGANKHNTFSAHILFILLALVAITIISPFLHVIYVRRSKNKTLVHSNSKYIASGPLSPYRVSYADLHEATNGYAATNLVGEGGFGKVYKGILERDGTVVAVKVFNPQHRGAAKSFITECESLRNIRHRNLVKIITVCSCLDIEGHMFRAIVYEFMENGSLEKWLHPSRRTYRDGLYRPRMLNLPTRMNIVIDVACALDYLHHQCVHPVTHCDLKPSNILLDSNMVARVADFGLAKFLPEIRNPDRSSLVGFRGTVGYAAPEYGMGSTVSTKGDVYSFGIFVLEMMTGKKPTDPMFHGGLNLHNYCWMALPDRVMDIVDPVIMRMASESNEQNDIQMKECLTMMLKVGVTCSKDSPRVRPDMRNVLRELQTIRRMYYMYLLDIRREREHLSFFAE